MNIFRLSIYAICLFFSSFLCGKEYRHKFLIPDLSMVPRDVLSALISGEEHPEIVRRGLVVQEYLPVTKKNILRMKAVIEPEIREPFENLFYPGKVQELRLLRKYLMEKGIKREVYQIAINRNEIVLESDERLKAVFKKLIPKSKGVVRKVFFEVIARDAHGNVLHDAQGNPLTVEIDILVQNVDHKIVPLFINGKIRAEHPFDLDSLPPYLGKDVTNDERVKAKNIIFFGLPHQIAAFSDNYKLNNRQFLTIILSQYLSWTNSDYIKMYQYPPKIPNNTVISKKILMNAEPFGFGPSAAIAEIFPYLRDRISHLSYIGKGHTINLQKRLPYDDLYEYSSEEDFVRVAKNYDVFITAVDAETASWAKKNGLKVIVYDPLTWYWQTIPDIFKEADLYIAQNFLGVVERLKQESQSFKEYAIVPPILSGWYGENDGEEGYLVNLGGLSNPYISDSTFANYARLIFSSLNEILNEPVFYATSEKIASQVQDVCLAKTYQPHEIQRILSQSQVAFMTSGLGNIFEASSMKKHIVWVPPTNVSQGQQLHLLKENHMIDHAIDWHDIIDDMPPIDYSLSDVQVMDQISQRLERLMTDIAIQKKLRKALHQAYFAASDKKHSKPSLAKLIEIFGMGGGIQIAEMIIEWIQESESKKEQSIQHFSLMTEY
ncbi:MAG: hypothetical protein K940chlam3_01050 [Chlamydiae bacterium]|nr:hypothetical protein [Chlamydiota bacterium]